MIEFIGCFVLYVSINKHATFINKQQVSNITLQLYRLETATPYNIMQPTRKKKQKKTPKSLKMITFHKCIYCRFLIRGYMNRSGIAVSVSLL